MVQEELKINIVEMQKRDEDLRKGEEDYKLVFEGASSVLWDWDLTNDRVYISKKWSNILGFEEQEIFSYHEKWISRIHPKDVERVILNFNDSLAGKSPFYICEYRIKLGNNKYLWILSRGKVLWDEQGKAIRIAGSHTDISDRKKTEKKLECLPYYDLLTGTPIRKIFMDRMKVSITEAKKNGLKLAVLLIDIDNFKTINGTYGYHIGDKLLKRITAKLKTCIGNTGTLCRICGDEFALFLPGFSNTNYVDEIVRKIIKLFHEPLVINNHKLYSTLSIGITIYPNDGGDGKTLLKNAGIAMYNAKEMGKNNLQYFNNYMAKQVGLHNDIRHDLKTVIENDELFLCYQPLIDAKTKRMVWMEALIRWDHPRKGIISPGEFIPIAEEMRLIIPIGEWVLQNACKQLKEWHEMNYINCGLSINVSSIQLEQPDFAEAVGRVLKENRLLPEYLDLEITESAFIGSIHTVTRNLILLRELGVKISIDDFGTGYNSLKYIQKILIDTIKIDRTFICNIKADINKVIIDTVISLGHRLNAEITVEGVETEEQYEYLKKQGCDKIQGYYFSKPLLPLEVVKFFKANSNEKQDL